MIPLNKLMPLTENPREPTIVGVMLDDADCTMVLGVLQDFDEHHLEIETVSGDTALIPMHRVVELQHGPGTELAHGKAALEWSRTEAETREELDEEDARFREALEEKPVPADLAELVSKVDLDG